MTERHTDAAVDAGRHDRRTASRRTDGPSPGRAADATTADAAGGAGRATPLSRRGLLRVGAGAGAASVAGLSGVGAAQSGPDYGGWFDDVSNFEGTVDYTGQDTVEVTVGTAGNGGNYAFGPPAIRVDPGATVVWQWNGKGGGHNVVDDDGSFSSDMSSSSGFTFEHAFESEGTFKYYCEPHKALGMKGAVVVGGSGGISPEEYESSTGGGSGEGTASGAGSGEGGGDGGDASVPAVDLANRASMLALAFAFVAAFLSPFAFAVVLFLNRVGDDAPTAEAAPE
jgi:halocyanin-like protein